MRRYRTALYLRLSKETEGNIQAHTIDNQRTFLLDYVERSMEFDVMGIYEDVQYTGANFVRPNFLRMIADLKAGKIDCIIVKDLSRLGRNYIETGEHLDQIFPFYNVRFISVNDNFDSSSYTNGQAMIVALKNILNDLQLRMLSSNIRKVTAMKRERGDYPSGGGAYGYQRSKDNPQQLIVDLNVAPIVREIFDMKLKGMSLKEIAGNLNDRGIMTPNAYWRSIGRIKSDKIGDPDSKWHHASIRCILQNPYYTGNCCNGRYKRGKMHERIRITDPKYAAEWAITRNTHEAIIDDESFDKVQDMLTESTKVWHDKYGKNGISHSIFPPIVFCAACGGAYKRKKLSKYGGGPKGNYRYYCSNRLKDDHICQNEETMSEIDLEEMVTSAIRYYLRKYNKAAKNPDTMHSTENKVTELKKTLTRLKGMKVALYESLNDGEITREVYLAKKEDLDKRIKETNRLIESGGKADQKTEEIGSQVKNFDSNKLTKEIIKSLIMKILIHNADEITVQFYPLPGSDDVIETRWSMVRQPKMVG